MVQTKISQNPEKAPNESELNNLPEREFKIKIINMLMEVQENIQELRNKFKSDTQSVRNSVFEMKHTMEGFKSRLDVNGIEIREEEFKEAEAQREKRISRNERIWREL